MNILYVGNFRLPRYDAAAARVVTIGKALCESGHRVSFISWGGKYNEYDRSSDGDYYISKMPYIVTNEIDGKSFLEKLGQKIHRGNKTLKIIKKLYVKPDAIITYNTPYGFNKKLFKYCRKRNISLIADITEWYDDNELKLLDRIPNKLNMTKFYKSISNIVSISSYLKNYYNEINSIVIPALVDHNDAKWHNQNTFKLDSFEGITLIYAGNPAKKDKLHVAVAATQTLINQGAKVRFIIAGCERKKYLKVFSMLYPDLTLSSNIIFLGRIDQEKIPALYGEADFMVLLREDNRKSEAGFPTKFTESMMSGTPVICNLTSDLGDYLIDGYNGFIVEDDSLESCLEVLKAKVLNLSPEKIKKMKYNARETGIRKLDYRNYTVKLNYFINNLA